MKAIDAYSATAKRARTLLRYHNGLTNNRSRGIRKDWKSSFLSLMHWPQLTNIERIDGKDAIVILRERATLTYDDFSQESLDDLLRASLTFGVSALDRYVHERVVKGIITALKASHLNRQQEDFVIPIKVSMQITSEITNAQKGGKKIRSANIVRKAVQDVLYKRPFQSWRDIDYAFCLLGITNLSNQLKTSYGTDIKPIMNQLNQIVGRRNAIVHEGDLEKHDRGGKVKMRPISRSYVESNLDFLDNFVNHLETVS